MIRDRFNDFVTRHEIAWEIAMASLAIVYVAIGFAIDVSESQPVLEAVDGVLTAIFIAEFSVRILASRDRRAYLREHLVDVIALIPIARGVRALRLLRLLRLVRAFAGMRRALLGVERLGNHHGLGSLVIAWFGTMFLCSWAFLLAESGSNPEVVEPGDAIWWGLMTLTGGPTIVAVTAEGQWITAILLGIGVALFTAITAVVVSFITSSDRRQRTIDLAALKGMAEQGLITEADYERAKSAYLEQAGVHTQAVTPGQPERGT